MITLKPAHRILRAACICAIASAAFSTTPTWSGERGPDLLPESLSSASNALTGTLTDLRANNANTNANASTDASADPLGDLIAAKIAPRPGKLQALGNRASELAMHAMGMLGINYKHGGNSPETGLDCSGMVRHVFKQAWGSILPRSALEISHVGEQVKPQDLQPGDLVFYNTMKRGFSHVGIYLGDNKFIHSPSVGGQVRIESMDLAYWKKRFDGARRMSDPGN